MALLEVRNAGKVYGTQSSPVTALADVSFSVAAGEFVALVGRSGCGKSTLLNLCGAMDFPSSGEVSIDGQVTSKLSDTALTRLRREKIGFVFQSFQLLHTLTALANVELPLLLARRANARRVAEERLGWVADGRLWGSFSASTFRRPTTARCNRPRTRARSSFGISRRAHREFGYGYSRYRTSSVAPDSGRAWRFGPTSDP